VVYGNLQSSTGNFVDGAPNIDTYSDWQALSASGYYLDGGAGGGGDGGGGQGITPTFTTAAARHIASPGGGIYANSGSLTLTPSNQAIGNSAIPQGQATTSNLPGLFGADLIPNSQLLMDGNANSAILESAPTTPGPTGTGNIPAPVQLLGSNMAGVNPTSLGESLLNHARFQHQPLDAIFVEGMDHPLSSVLDLGL
jgi:hypothetical protein